MKNLKVLLEFEKLSNPYSGLGQFCLNLGKNLIKNTVDIDFQFLLPKTNHNYFDNFKNIYFSNKIKRIFPYSGSEFDVWHCIHQESPYLPYNSNTKIVLTIHDLNFLHKDYPEWKKKYKLKKLQKKVDKAHAITTISQYTAQEIKKHLNISSDKYFEVIYNGNGLSDCENDKKPDIVPESDYIFSLGIINPKKNFKTLVPLLNFNENLKLVISGINTGNYANEILEYAKDLNFQNRVILTGTISESEKYHLYKNCMAFVFPSLSEGFGLPVVEAMSFGKPIFLSNLTSLPEIGGNLAYYWENFDPEYMNDIFDKGMNNYKNNPEKKQQLIEHSKNFSWETSAKKYVELYKKLA